MKNKNKLIKKFKTYLVHKLGERTLEENLKDNRIIREYRGKVITLKNVAVIRNNEYPREFVERDLANSFLEDIKKYMSVEITSPGIGITEYRGVIRIVVGE